jgi:hypothetical protein
MVVPRGPRVSSRAKRGIPLVLAAALAACATLPPEIPEAADCRANYLALDARVAAADARNGGARAIPGFPYLRSDRFLASFADEAADGPAFDAWVGRLRRLDLESRASELRNIGWDDPAEELKHLERCGADWAARDLADPQRRAQLRERAAVPDDYSLWRRALGLYPLAVPFLNMGIRSFNEDVQADYARPLPLLDAVLWSPVVGAPSGATVGAAPVGAAHGRDSLGIPMLSEADWHHLATTHAPTWQVEVRGEYDRVGTPVLRAGDAPTVDTARPVTYFVPAYTRFGDKVLVQLVYVAWFSERPKSAGYSYGGALDGVVWRVTLDETGKPLLYDTIHACGCYHYYYLAQPLKRREQGGFWQEPVLFPQEAPAMPFVVRLQARTHYVRRLVPLADVGAAHGRDSHAYRLADYDELLSLPDGKGGTRSLFCEDGLACGTARFERFWLWPAGIKSAGAMRQWGRHATSFVGRSHFDDPSMLDRLFEPEPAVR